MLIPFLLLTASAHALTLPAKPDAKFTRLTPGIEARFGSDPLHVDLRAEKAKLEGATLTLRPVFKKHYFQTSHPENSFKCVAEPSGEDDSDEPKYVVAENDDLADATVDLARGKYDAATKTLSLDLPSPMVLEPTTKTLEARLKLNPKKTIVARISLAKPITLPPLLAEMFKQYRKIGLWPEFHDPKKPLPPAPVVITPAFPPHVKRIANDECYDRELREENFTGQGTLGMVGGWRLVEENAWFFSAKATESEPFPWDKVSLKNQTFLGDNYVFEKASVKTTAKRLEATYVMGDFSGCFGASCGDPVNQRDVIVSLTGDGKMATSFQDHVEPTEE